ncbi:BspA family leucine-rich repeat surface protein [Kordia sp. YSTF-M3]|uniref:BspA family leucine-rich repeat surface protein n=1 Tax=Kordia aestuariivivens TaxID=2759037 RepID=A0ABR7Q799_9FLAO|nr:BspA family leucine-rich repeat surface protein [Kordia aestuariivivens]MBC8754430.1 BspA family leucine-rich repeat surface protein [Kordia aestuariivivens]
MKKALLIILTILVSYTAFSQCMVEEVSLTERINKSSIIIEGEVISQQGFWDAKRQNIFTVNTIKPFKNFKGALFNSTTIDIITMGGTVGLTRLDISNALKLTIGDVGLFILKDSPVSLTKRGNFLTTVEGAQGFIKYDLFDGSANDGFKRYPSVEKQLYALIASKVGKKFSVLKRVNLFQNNKNVQVNFISSYSPTIVNAGVSDILTIIGAGFGSTQGTVQFRDSNTGGTTWISALDSDIISWADNQIQVKVISNASTGEVRVQRSNNQIVTSLGGQILTVNWAHSNVESDFVTNTPINYETSLRAKDANGGYEFEFAPNFSNTNERSAFDRALATWNCGSGVNFENSGYTSISVLASDGTNAVMYKSTTQIVADGGSASSLAFAASWYIGCDNGGAIEWYVKEIDVVINSDINWYYGSGDPGDPTKYSFETVILHELGHAQQLGHVADQNEIMYYALGTGVSLTTLTPETLNGAAYVMNKSTTTSVCNKSVMTTYAGCCNDPEVASHSSDVFKCVEESASFSITSNYGTTFRWQVNNGSGWTNIQDTNTFYSNANTMELTIVAIKANMDTNQYRCVVSNSCTATASSNASTLTIEASPTATLSATAETACENNDGTITFTFPDSPDRTGIEFSINGGSTYPYYYDDDIGSATITNLAPATYSVYARYGDDTCATETGDITVDSNNYPQASVSSSTTLDCINNIGSVTLTWVQDPSRDNIEFSTDGGNTYPYNTLLSANELTIPNLSTGVIDLWVRWGSDECPVDMEDVTINIPNCNFSNSFITTWKTDNTGDSANNSITIPTESSGTYNYYVDWGDGQFDYNVTASTTHTYASAGTYTVKIIGDFPQIYFNDSGDKEKILSVDQWGSTNWTSMNRAFYGCSNLVVNANDSPDLSGVTSLAGMFRNASSFNQDISAWNVSSITTMGYMFDGATAFNQNISGWNVSAVENMSHMFRNASNFNQNLANWDVSNVTNMGNMFRSATSFDQDLGAWDISSITNMTSMFTSVALSSLNYDTTLIGWNTLSATETQIPANIIFSGGNSNFCNAEDARTNLDTTHNWTITDGGKDCSSALITTWKTDNSGVTNTNSIKISSDGNYNNYNYTINWGDGTTNSNVTDDSITHAYTTPGTYTVTITGDFPRIYFGTSGDGKKLLSVDQWGIQVWKTMEKSFSGCTNMVINATDSPDLSEVTSFYRIFRGATAMNQDISAWDVSSVTNMNEAFYEATAFNQDISAWDVSAVTNMRYMFRNAFNFNQDLANWDVSNVTNMGEMFRSATSFDQDLGTWDISSITNMSSMFASVTLSLSNYDDTLIGWNTLSATETQIPTNIILSGGFSKYCAGEPARTNLINTHGWTIADGGKDCSSAFITTWKTDNPGDTNTNSIKISTSSLYNYNYTINWGDGTINYNVTGDITHAYATSGTYTVTIIDDFPQILLNSGGDKEKLLSVDQWGNQVWKSMENSFSGCTNMVINATDSPDLSEVTSFFRVFSGAAAMNQDISAWNVSTVTNFNQAFYGATTFNQDISVWDVRNATSMNQMFREATDFNQDLGTWDVSNVASMNQMFREAVNFDQNLGDWDISSILSMTSMFQNITLSLSNYDTTLIGWNTLSATETQIPANITFSGGGSNFCIGEDAHINLDTTHNWTITDGGKDCSSAFITTWKTDNSGDTNNNSIKIRISGLRNYNYAINWGDGKTNSNVTENITHAYTTPGTYTVTITGDFPYFGFGNTGDPEKLLSVDQWGNQVWKSMSSSFWGCTNMVINATDSPDLSEVTSFYSVFRDATAMNQDISAWDVSSVTDMNYAFYGATAFNQDISTWDVSSVTNMSSAFYRATAFNQNISTWDVSSVTNMSYAFFLTTAFNQDISAWDVSAVTDMRYMFWSATNFDQNLANWDISSIRNMTNMFRYITLSSSNYDNTLIGWNTLSATETQIPTNITFSGGDSKYCAGKTARTNLINTHGWTIADGGKDCSSAFITTWKTDNPGTTNANSIKIFTNGINPYNYTINWGDDTANYNVTGDITHAYATSGTYTVTITGDFPYFGFGNSGDEEKLLSVDRWGNQVWKSMESSFYGCTNMVINATDSPDLSEVTSFYRIFRDAETMNQDISAWDVSTITTFSEAFFGATAFDQDLGAWDISSMLSMTLMFDNVAMSTSNYDDTLIGWNTLSATETQIPTNIIFSGGNSNFCNAENARTNLDTTHNWTITDGGKDCSLAFITTWKTDNSGTTDNNSIKIPRNSLYNYNYNINWGDGTTNLNVTGNITHAYTTSGTYTVTITGDFPQIYFGNTGDPEKLLSVDQWGNQVWKSMRESFYGCRNMVINATDSPDLSEVTSFYRIFRGAEAINQDISTWDVSSVTDMFQAFYGATAFNQDISIWDVSAVTEMGNMFRNAFSFDQNLANWDISKVTNMLYMFLNATLSISNYDNTLIGWNTLSATETQIPTNIIFSGGNSKYCVGKAARTNLRNTHGWTITDAGRDCAKVAIKVVLQGATFNPNAGEETLMRDDLRVAGLLPVTSPYTDAIVANATVFNRGGTSGTEPINNDIVDWIFVEFRDATNSSVTVASQSALLQRDGDVVAINGISDLYLNLAAGSYYVVVKHRNHLGVMTKNSFTLDASRVLLDFTDITGIADTNNQFTYGSNAQAIIAGSPNTLALWSGNTNGDQYIQYTGATPDVPNILSTVLNNLGNFLNFPTYSFSEYSMNDVDMDGNIQYSGATPDTPFILQNTLSHPGNFLNFSTHRIEEQLPEN